MPFIQILLTAASLAAVAGGSLGVDRLVDRYARIAETPAASADATVEEEDEESKLLY